MNNIDTYLEELKIFDEDSCVFSECYNKPYEDRDATLITTKRYCFSIMFKKDQDGMYHINLYFIHSGVLGLIGNISCLSNFYSSAKLMHLYATCKINYFFKSNNIPFDKIKSVRLSGASLGGCMSLNAIDFMYESICQMINCEKISISIFCPFGQNKLAFHQNKILWKDILDRGIKIDYKCFCNLGDPISSTGTLALIDKPHKNLSEKYFALDLTPQERIFFSQLKNPFEHTFASGRKMHLIAGNYDRVSQMSKEQLGRIRYRVFNVEKKFSRYLVSIFKEYDQENICYTFKNKGKGALKMFFFTFFSIPFLKQISHKMELLIRKYDFLCLRKKILPQFAISNPDLYVALQKETTSENFFIQWNKLRVKNSQSEST